MEAASVEPTPTDPSPEPKVERSARHVLAPGPYFVEVRFTRLVEPSIVASAMRTAGFGDGAGEGPALDAATTGDADTVRFVGVLSRRTELVDTDVVRWAVVLPLSHDPFADIRRTVAPLEVDKGRSYDLRFISRMKTGATRAEVAKTLEEIGFAASALSCLKRNIHLPGRKGVDCAVWCAPRAFWTGPKTVLTVEEPLAFEDASLSFMSQEPAPP